MELTTEQRGQVAVVTVNGSLDALTAPELGHAFAQLTDAGIFKLVANLEGVDYSSSAGLRVLLTAFKQARQNDGDLRLAFVQDGVNKVLNLAGLASKVSQYADVETAVASFEDVG